MAHMSMHLPGSPALVFSKSERARGVATVTGAAFLLIGILGFIPGITTGYGDMSFAGHHSGAELLGIFQVSILHNLVHLAFGIAGLAMAKSISNATTFLIGGGVIYLALGAFGAIVEHGSDANIVPVNSADNWLHLVLGAGMILLGLATRPGGLLRRAG